VPISRLLIIDFHKIFTCVFYFIDKKSFRREKRTSLHISSTIVWIVYNIYIFYKVILLALCTYTSMLILYSVHYTTQRCHTYIICSMYTIVTYSHALKRSLHLIIILVTYSNIKYYAFPSQQIWLYNVFYEFSSTIHSHIIFSFYGRYTTKCKINKILIFRYCILTIVLFWFCSFRLLKWIGFYYGELFFAVSEIIGLNASLIGNMNIGIPIICLVLYLNI